MRWMDVLKCAAVSLGRVSSDELCPTSTPEAPKTMAEDEMQYSTGTTN